MAEKIADGKQIDAKEGTAGINAGASGESSQSGKDFIEQGEVPEGRIVEGRNMTFLANVFGTVVSRNGHVLLEKDLANGSVQSANGDVTANGRVSNSIIEVHDKSGLSVVGRIVLNQAEACLILGHSVIIKHAINCDIIAEHVEIEHLEGCSIVAKTVKVGSSNVFRRRETNVAMMLPDLTEIEAKITQAKRSVEKCDKAIKVIEQDWAKVTSNPEIAKYLALAASIEKSAVKLTPAQQENWEKMTAKFRFAKVDTILSRLKANKEDQKKLMQGFQLELSNLIAERDKFGPGVRCKISGVAGGTLVRILPPVPKMVDLQKLKANDIKVKLRENGTPQDQVFFNDEGSLEWQYKVPAMVYSEPETK